MQHEIHSLQFICFIESCKFPSFDSLLIKKLTFVTIFIYQARKIVGKCMDPIGNEVYSIDGKNMHLIEKEGTDLNLCVNFLFIGRCKDPGISNCH